MHRLNVAVTKDTAGDVHEVHITAPTGVRLVTAHHGRPLGITHRAGTGIGEQVDVDGLGG